MAAARFSGPAALGHRAVRMHGSCSLSGPAPCSGYGIGPSRAYGCRFGPCRESRRPRRPPGRQGAASAGGRRRVNPSVDRARPPGARARFGPPHGAARPRRLNLQPPGRPPRAPSARCGAAWCSRAAALPPDLSRRRRRLVLEGRRPAAMPTRARIADTCLGGPRRVRAAGRRPSTAAAACTCRRPNSLSRLRPSAALMSIARRIWAAPPGARAEFGPPTAVEFL